MRIHKLVLMAGAISGFAALGLMAQAPPATPVPPARITKVAVVSPSTSFLGIGIQEIDSDRSKALKLQQEAGVEITHVDTDSPAEKAGLKTGDVVVEYNGQRVEGIEQFSRMVHETPAGREVKLGVFRNGARVVVAAKLGSRPTSLTQRIPDAIGNLTERIPDIPHPMMGWRSGILGIEAESIDGQFAQYFGVKEGVLVRTVMKDSPAEKAGIKAGDVIVRVEDAKVTTTSDITSHLRTQRGKPVPVVLMRERKEITVSVTVEGDSKSFHGGWPHLRPAII